MMQVKTKIFQSGVYFLPVHSSDVYNAQIYIVIHTYY
jgi:hypothetical protein